ncbi:MAG: DUF2314 domain-containing protein [Pseudomonadota bacterium]
MHNSFRLLILVALLTLGASLTAAPFAVAQTKPAPQSPDQGDPVTLFDDADATMNAAISEAVATLPIFLANAMTTDGFGLPSAMLKVAMPTVSGGGDEIIWVEGISQTSTGFAGYLANAPVDLGPLRHGDYVEFQAAQINDWGIRSPSGRLFGHYTTRVIAGLPGNAHIWDLLEPSPIPPDWR